MGWGNSMSEIFTASNGVRLDELGRVMMGAPKIPSQEESHEARKEFYLAERDKELGRWRSKKNPHWVVVPGEWGTRRAFNESTGETHLFHSKPDLSIMYYDSVREIIEEYWDEHKPKPWQEAKPGEVWLLTVDGRESAFVLDADQEFNGVNRNGQYVCGWQGDPRITAGRRIWPEED